MARTKRVPFAIWETTTSDGIEKRYFRMGASFMAAEPVRNLSPSAFKTLCYMKIESAGQREFTFPHAKYKSFMSKPTFSKALKDLVAHGFVEVVQHNKNLRKPNVYRFSDAWKSYSDTKQNP